MKERENICWGTIYARPLAELDTFRWRNRTRGRRREEKNILNVENRCHHPHHTHRHTDLRQVKNLVGSMAGCLCCSTPFWKGSTRRQNSERLGAGTWESMDMGSGPSSATSDFENLVSPSPSFPIRDKWGWRVCRQLLRGLNERVNVKRWVWRLARSKGPTKASAAVCREAQAGCEVPLRPRGRKWGLAAAVSDDVPSLTLTLLRHTEEQQWAMTKVTETGAKYFLWFRQNC